MTGSRVNIAGAAGGVGTSTLAVALAALAGGCAIARDGRRDLRHLTEVDVGTGPTDVAFFGTEPWHFFDAGRDLTNPAIPTVVVVPRRYAGIRTAVEALATPHHRLVGVVAWASACDTLALDDLRSAIDLPLLGTVTERPELARAIDAGIWLERWHRSWEAEIRTIHTTLQEVLDA